MKRNTTTIVSNTSFAMKASVIAAAILMVASAPVALMTSTAHADYYSDRIKALQSEIDQYQAKAGELKEKANSLQAELDRLTNEKAIIQKQIDINQAKYDQLVADIKANEEKLAKNQDILGNIVANLYVDDKISSLELFASSENIGDFVDKQEYRTAVQQRLATTISEIKRLKKELDEQKLSVERILADQKGQREVLAAKEAEQQQLVDQTRGEEAAYQSLSADRTSKKNEVQRQQQAAIEAAMRRSGGGGRAVAGDPNKGGYPSNLANSDYYNPVVDPWGMYSRQCVSYTAWKVYQKNGYMPYWGGRGNANQWPGNARAAGIATGSAPRAGSVGVMMAGQYGHVVWVESVNANGTINISQYNYLNAGGAGWGNYSEMYNVSPSAYNVYIYF